MKKISNRKKGISALNYIKSNRKRTLVLVLSLGFFITMLYGVAFLFSTITASGYSVYISSREKMQIILPDSEILDINRSIFKDENASEMEKRAEYNRGLMIMADKLKSVTNIDQVFPCSVHGIELKTIFGQLFYDFVIVEADTVPVIMNYQGIKLAEGYVPSKPGEIIIDSTMARNLKLTIGDKISGFDYTITGIAKSKYYFACAVDDYSTWNPGLLILSNGKHKDYLSLCKQLGYPPNKIRLDDYINGKQDFLTNIVEILVLSKNLITILSSILLSICIIVVFHMYIHDRHEEWCLYHSIGFSIKDVFLLANRELLLSFSLAVLFALAVSTVFVILLKLLLIIPMGIMCTPFIPSEMLNILCILIMLFGILQIPLSFAMHRIKTIDAISEEAI